MAQKLTVYANWKTLTLDVSDNYVLPRSFTSEWFVVNSTEDEQLLIPISQILGLHLEPITPPPTAEESPVDA